MTNLIQEYYLVVIKALHVSRCNAYFFGQNKWRRGGKFRGRIFHMMLPLSISKLGLLSIVRARVPIIKVRLNNMRYHRGVGLERKKKKRTHYNNYYNNIILLKTWTEE